jgi:hypothetical protein
MATLKRHVPKAGDLDLAGATRAELSVEYWGGHIGTAGQRFRVNDHSWIDLPTPVRNADRAPALLPHAARQQRRRRSRSTSCATAKTSSVHRGQADRLRQRLGILLDLRLYTARVYYDAARKPHPVGEVISPQPARPSATAAAGGQAEQPQRPIVRVEFIGEYDDFDWDGDGVWREWQYSTHHGVLRHHLGTVASRPGA